LPEEEALATVGPTGMPAATDRTISTPEASAEELARIRERRYAIDDGEPEIAVRCPPPPVRGGPALRACCAPGPEARAPPDCADRAAPILQRAAPALASDLNHQN